MKAKEDPQRVGEEVMASPCIFAGFGLCNMDGYDCAFIELIHHSTNKKLTLLFHPEAMVALRDSITDVVAQFPEVFQNAFKE